MASKGVSLHIGLNEVDPNHYAGWSGKLVACEADARDMAAIAASKGYRVAALMTKDATRAHVRSAIDEAAKELRSGDIFFLTYSGHGGQVPDQDGDEEDGNDETWCLFDAEMIDDEIWELYTHFSEGVRILVLSDSCHSGSVSRDAQFRAIAASPELRAAFGVEEGALSRGMPDPIALRVYEQHRAFYDGIAANMPSKAQSKEQLMARVRLISGCQDDQTSADGRYNGLFTGTLKTVWNGGTFTRNYRAFHRAIRRRMPTTQVPNHYLIGPANPAFDAQSPFTI
jgi:metacaspase-1